VWPASRKWFPSCAISASTLLFCAWLAWSRFRVVIPTWDRSLPTLVAFLDTTLRRLGGAPTCAGFCDHVNGRVHRATGRVPAEMLVADRARLHVLPAAPHTLALGTPRTVNTDQTVRVGSVRYSTPPGLVGAQVWVRPDGDELVVPTAAPRSRLRGPAPRRRRRFWHWAPGRTPGWSRPPPSERHGGGPSWPTPSSWPPWSAPTPSMPPPGSPPPRAGSPRPTCSRSSSTAPPARPASTWCTPTRPTPSSPAPPAGRVHHHLPPVPPPRPVPPGHRPHPYRSTSHLMSPPTFQVTRTLALPPGGSSTRPSPVPPTPALPDPPVPTVPVTSSPTRWAWNSLTGGCTRDGLHQHRGSHPRPRSSSPNPFSRNTCDPDGGFGHGGGPGTGATRRGGRRASGRRAGGRGGSSTGPSPTPPTPVPLDPPIRDRDTKFTAAFDAVLGTRTSRS
jgi:hypothetical protein